MHNPYDICIFIIIFSLFRPDNQTGKITFELSELFFFNLLVLIPMGIFISKENGDVRRSIGNIEQEICSPLPKVSAL